MKNERVILGLWPIAGITTVGVSEDDAIATLHAAIDAGIHQFDTAFSYGYDGESDRILGHVLRERNSDATVIGKVGQRWVGKQRVVDGNPTTLIADAESSLSRIGLPCFDTLMLHSVDPSVPIERAAEALDQLRQRQLCRHVGVCNATVDQLQRFAKVTQCRAVQCPLNLMQRDSLDGLIPYAARCEMQVYVFWALMKGLLAGKIGPDHVFDRDDPRPRYDIFQGAFRRRAHGVIEGLAKIGQQCQRSVAQLAVGWTLSQNGVTAALVGARRPQQVIELAQSKPLSESVVAEIDDLVTGALRRS